MKKKIKRGKFIVLYGVNNLGKTTQAKLLVKKLRKNGHTTEYIKYPIYQSEPAGPLINGYLRKGNPHNFSPRELQILHFIDRINFEPVLKNKLAKGINIVAEDYFGTALAWGIGAGVNKKLLEYLYAFVQKEDLSILFDGERFRDSIEKNHRHENNEKLANRVRKTHIMIGKKYGWEKINANLSVDEIKDIIWAKAEKILKK